MWSTARCAAPCSVEELSKLDGAAPTGRYRDPAKLFGELIESDTFPEFLTIPAYDMITRA